MIRFQFDYEPRVCSVDPLSIGAVLTGIGGLFGGGSTLAAAGLGAATAMTASALSGSAAPSSAPSASTPTAAPEAPPPAAPPASAPIGTRSGQNQNQPSFVGSSSTAPPQQGYGQKTLLGQ